MERRESDTPTWPDQSARSREPVPSLEYVQPVEPVMPVQPVRRVRRASGPSLSYRAAQVVYLILGIVEVLLLIRFLLRLLAANPAASFTSLVYGVTGPLVSPFQGVFPNASAHGSVLDLAAVLAMIVYALLAWGVVKVFEITERRSLTP